MSQMSTVVTVPTLARCTPVTPKHRLASIITARETPPAGGGGSE